MAFKMCLTLPPSKVVKPSMNSVYISGVCLSTLGERVSSKINIVVAWIILIQSVSFN